ncbi:Ubiquitin-conjugating enzyme E2 T [Tetrabaena socialis]|uniref:Ubiquitin-conjugating enzyme E2 T n=1 Tax=Tetrabaena socialis TaxID=47790 RepID=A0A2J7ZPL0_9CHLO|nr:Ubiquitin-conjugating enzyme E2 T [Tetrabaena socialis]|eukprot:PNH02203.1 Ubiquitin-conjugating enzyme E2 T [Tetrabaena socialis]
MSLPSAVSLNRRARELKDLTNAPPAGIAVWASSDSSLEVVETQIAGPEGTPYAGGLFHLLASFPARYPMEPPNVKFKTRGTWTPALSLRTVLLSIQSLLAEPNPDDPLDADAAKEYLANRWLFNSRAAEFTRRHARPDLIAPEGAQTAAASCATAPAAGPSRDAQVAGHSGRADAASAAGPSDAGPSNAGAGASNASHPGGPRAHEDPAPGPGPSGAGQSDSHAGAASDAAASAPLGTGSEAGAAAERQAAPDVLEREAKDGSLAGAADGVDPATAAGTSTTGTGKRAAEERPASRLSRLRKK